MEDSVVKRYVSKHAVEQLRERMDWVSDELSDLEVQEILDRAIYIALDREDRQVRSGPDTQGEQAVLVKVTQEDFDDAGGGVEGMTFAMVKKNAQRSSPYDECVVTVLSPLMADKLMPLEEPWQPLTASVSATEKSVQLRTAGVDISDQDASIPGREVNKRKTADLLLAVAQSNLIDSDKKDVIARLIGG